MVGTNFLCEFSRITSAADVNPITTTHTDCTMWLKNDDVYEGVEALYLELDHTPLDTGVRIDQERRTATIYIHDSDDGAYCVPSYLRMYVCRLNFYSHVE